MYPDIWLCYTEEACLSSVFSLRTSIDQLVLCHYKWTIELFCGNFDIFTAPWWIVSPPCAPADSGALGEESGESQGGGFALSSPLSSQIKITVINPEAGLSCHCVMETAIWLVMNVNSPRAIISLMGDLNRNPFQCVWGVVGSEGGGLGRAPCCESVVIRCSLHTQFTGGSFQWGWPWFLISPTVHFKLLLMIDAQKEDGSVLSKHSLSYSSILPCYRRTSAEGMCVNNTGRGLQR